jgi:DNA-binding transcriptional regulator YiaG
MKPSAPRPYIPPSPEQMRALVAATGLPHAELARRLAVTPRTIEHWRAGTRNASYVAVFALECLGSSWIA